MRRGPLEAPTTHSQANAEFSQSPHTTIIKRLDSIPNQVKALGMHDERLFRLSSYWVSALVALLSEVEMILSTLGRYVILMTTFMRICYGLS